MGEIAVFLGEIGFVLTIISILCLIKGYTGFDDTHKKITYFEGIFCFKGINLENLKIKIKQRPKKKFLNILFWLKLTPEFIYFFFAISVYIGFICLILGLILVLIYYNF